MIRKSRGSIVLVAVGSWVVALAHVGHAPAQPPAASQPSATQQTAATAEAQGGHLIWATQGRLENGKPAGFVIYKVAAGPGGLYVVGNKVNQGGAIIEKLNPADGSLVWPNYQKIEGANEGMHLAIDSEFMYVAAEPWMLEKRKLTDGSLIWQQKGEKGKPYTVVIDSTGAYMGGHGFRMEKRSLADGSLLWQKASSPTGVVLAAAVDSTGIYFGGYRRIDGDQHWRIEKRDLKDGSLIWEQMTNPSKGADVVYGLAVDASGVYAAGLDSSNDSGGQWRLEKRSPSNGKLIWQQMDNPTPEMDKAHGLTIDSTGLYIPGYQGNQWRIQKRSLSNGSLIWQALGLRGGVLWYAISVDDEAVYVGGHIDRQWRIEKRAK